LTTWPPASGAIAVAISNANNVAASAKAYRLGVLLKKMEVEKDSAGLMSPPLAGGRDSEREVILPQGPSLDERYSGCGMVSACLGHDDCATQAAIEAREHQSLIIGNQRLPTKERCNQKTSSS